MSYVKKLSLLFCLSIGLFPSLNGMSYFRGLQANAISLYSYIASFVGKYKTESQNWLLSYKIPYSSQTSTHLQNNANIIEGGLMKKFLETPELRKVWEDVTSKEYELHEQYYTFLHAQQKIYYWPEKLYTFLWNIQNKESYEDFFFAHVKSDKSKNINEFMESETQRIFLLNNKEYADREAVYKNLLFMNYALFANDGWSGNNSAYLLSSNFNWNHSRVFIKPSDVFELFDYKIVYEKFKTEIENLWQEHKNLSSYGNLLLFAIPKNDIHNYVFLCDDYGRKKEIFIKGLGYTDDIEIIMETLLKQPERLSNTDLMQFALVMFHKNGGLDPRTGIKAFTFIAANQEKLKEYLAKEEDLLKRIKNYITNKDFFSLLANDKVLAKGMGRVTTLFKHLFPKE